MTEGLRTGVLGGTFDPIHLGHLALAEAARGALALDAVLLLPSRVPPHRERGPVASPADRLAMTALAAEGRPSLAASDLELRRKGPSYTAETLRALHAAGYPPLGLYFLIGTDAFAEIATWHAFPAVLNLAHFVVCARPGAPLSVGAVRELVGIDRPIRRLDSAPTAEDAAGATPDQTGILLLDAATPAVSSTEIRARARAGRPLAGLVPPEVEQYIRRHGLYGAPPEPDAGVSARGRRLA